MSSVAGSPRSITSQHTFDDGTSSANSGQELLPEQPDLPPPAYSEGSYGGAYSDAASTRVEPPSSTIHRRNTPQQFIANPGPPPISNVLQNQSNLSSDYRFDTVLEAQQSNAAFQEQMRYRRKTTYGCCCCTACNVSVALVAATVLGIFGFGALYLSPANSQASLSSFSSCLAAL